MKQMFKQILQDNKPYEVMALVTLITHAPLVHALHYGEDYNGEPTPHTKPDRILYDIFEEFLQLLNPIDDEEEYYDAEEEILELILKVHKDIVENGHLINKSSILEYLSK